MARVRGPQPLLKRPQRYQSRRLRPSRVSSWLRCLEQARSRTGGPSEKRLEWLPALDTFPQQLKSRLSMSARTQIVSSFVMGPNGASIE